MHSANTSPGFSGEKHHTLCTRHRKSCAQLIYIFWMKTNLEKVQRATFSRPSLCVNSPLCGGALSILLSNCVTRQKALVVVQLLSFTWIWSASWQVVVPYSIEINWWRINCRACWPIQLSKVSKTEWDIFSWAFPDGCQVAHSSYILLSFLKPQCIPLLL